MCERNWSLTSNLELLNVLRICSCPGHSNSHSIIGFSSRHGHVHRQTPCPVVVPSRDLCRLLISEPQVKDSVRMKGTIDINKLMGYVFELQCQRTPDNSQGLRGFEMKNGHYTKIWGLYEFYSDGYYNKR